MARHRQLVSHVLGWTMFGAAVILLLGSVGAGAITYENAYADRIFPGVRVGPIVVGGLSKADGSARIQLALDAFLGQGIPYVLDGRIVTIDPIVTAPQDPDLTYRLIEVDVPKLVDSAFTLGRRPSLVAAWSERARGAIRDDLVVPITASVDRKRLEEALAENLSRDLPAMRPPRVEPVVTDGVVSWNVVAGQSGRRIDIAAVAAETEQRIAALDPAPVLVPTIEAAPPYTTEEVIAALPRIEAALGRAPLTLTHGEQRWTAEATTLAGWFTFGDRPEPVLDRNAINAFLTPIAKDIERQAENARLSINPTTKRVREFRSAREGVRIERDALVAALQDAVFGTRPPLIAIPTAVEAPTVAVADTNDLGIRELLGVGRTKFTGSPPNRRHNIGIGAGLLNGVLIAPDEEFSTVGAVSPFTAETGYKPELVIKGSRTIPEYGGGLCQVSTTLFRTVLATGLPVTERANHAYRVPYYEPPVGMDATIYGPKPDFKFVNDTGHHLLLRTRIEGDELIYELWGTNDGRVASSSEPEVFNFVSPPPAKTVETADLPPGKKKCTERAHTGADAKFTYTVTHADGTKDERIFKSHYRPWQAVCLVGKQLPAPSSQSQADENASTETGTPGTVNAPTPTLTAPPLPATPAEEAPPQIN